MKSITTVNQFDRQYYFDDYMNSQTSSIPRYLCGVDEVGRGPLAGPVVACASLIPSKKIDTTLDRLASLGVTDSKKLSSVKRQKILLSLGIELKQLKANKVYQLEEFHFCIEEISPREIDRINILQASLKAMNLAVESLHHQQMEKSGVVLVDGNKLPQTGLEKDLVTFKSVIKGDSKCLSIALSSIIAKEYRDSLMKNLHQQFPMYNWQKNAGYPTLEHRNALALHGHTPHHRLSFISSSECKL